MHAVYCTQQHTEQSGVENAKEYTASTQHTYPACNWIGAVQGHRLGQGRQQICQGGQGQQYYVHEPIDSNIEYRQMYIIENNTGKNYREKQMKS